MKNVKFLIIIILAAGLIVVQGCISFRSSPGGIEPSSSPLKSNDYEILGSSEAEASNFTLLHLITLTPEPDLDRAIGTV